MTFYVENETDVTFDFDIQEIVESVAMEILDTEECPYESQVNVLLTDNKGIHAFNKEYRHIDRETDRWPRGISRDARFPEIDRILKEKVDAQLPLGPVCMEVDQCDPTKIYLRAADEETEKRLRSFRDRVSEVTGIHHPNHEGFRFHISVSYRLQPFDEKQQEECDKLCQEATQLLKETVKPFWGPEPQFVVFNDMMCFRPELSWRGDLY